MSIYKSLDTYLEIELCKGWKYRIKKLNLGESLEFLIIWNVYLATREGLDDIIALVAFDDNKLGFLTKEEKKTIGESAREFNYDANKKTEKKTEKKTDKKDKNETWLQSLFAYFGREFGYTKKDVLSLYPDEIPLIIAENKKLKDAENMNMIVIFHKPELEIDRLKAKELISEMFNPEPLDQEKIDAIKASQRGDHGGK